MSLKVSFNRQGFVSLITAIAGAALLVVLIAYMGFLIGTRSSQPAQQPKAPIFQELSPTPLTTLKHPRPGGAVLFVELIPVDAASLAKSSDTIVIGTVKYQLPGQLVTEKLTNTDLVYTDTIIAVEEYLKKQLPFEGIVVRLLGGTAGGRTLRVDVAPSLIQGEKVLLFLSKEAIDFELGENEFTVNGWHQGVYTIEGNQATRKDGRAIEQLDKLLQTIGINQ